jgi:hypothetical protein
VVRCSLGLGSPGLFYLVLHQARALHRAAVPGCRTADGHLLARSLFDPDIKGRRASIHTMMAIGYVLVIGFASLPSLYPSFAGNLPKNFRWRPRSV